VAETTQKVGLNADLRECVNQSVFCQLHLLHKYFTVAGMIQSGCNFHGRQDFIKLKISQLRGYISSHRLFLVKNQSVKTELKTFPKRLPPPLSHACPARLGADRNPKTQTLNPQHQTPNPEYLSLTPKRSHALPAWLGVSTIEPPSDTQWYLAHNTSPMMKRPPP